MSLPPKQTATSCKLMWGGVNMEVAHVTESIRFCLASERGISSGSWLPVMMIGFLKPSNIMDSAEAVYDIVVSAMHNEECIIQVALGMQNPSKFDPLLGANPAAILIEHHFQI
eukprot:CAMPEP_0177789502 /NCGR_PEP_ID=MMETSP0491_2-20121128/22791_1 /TAXON_ID=63592 /ORGANISM="Tetraselmis chuii, Strain PLY429" /LENGTH=112 /DNA_ID=CAMNT_0019311385 /DNA_START=538 /DNA_END=875 /DNA_ORIENTATION=-